MQGATGVIDSSTFKIDLSFVNSPIVMADMLAMEYVGGSNSYDVLIGRDVICQGVLTLDFSGHFSFAI